MMADLDVVPKRGTKLWLWVVLAVVIIAILWMAFGRRSSPATGQMHDNSGHLMPSASAAIPTVGPAV
jgi:bacteriorhodopsin